MINNEDRKPRADLKGARGDRQVNGVKMKLPCVEFHPARICEAVACVESEPAHTVLKVTGVEMKLNGAEFRLAFVDGRGGVHLNEGGAR